MSMYGRLSTLTFCVGISATVKVFRRFFFFPFSFCRIHQVQFGVGSLLISALLLFVVLKRREVFLSDYLVWFMIYFSVMTDFAWFI